MVVVASLYKFFPVKDCLGLITDVKALCAKHSIKGTLLIAPEGINGTIAGPESGIDEVITMICSYSNDLELKKSFCDHVPFYRMKVRLKKEIVTFGRDEIDPLQQVGTYVDPLDWNKLITRPDITLIDTRNDYEVRIGTFKGAHNPFIKTFKQFASYVTGNLSKKTNPKIAMFCTGGIRCEKASAYMLKEGFEEVYHLKGGILKYLELIKKEDSLWRGECFVFDQRVSIGCELKEGTHSSCFSCRQPLSVDDCRSIHYKEGISCPFCVGSITRAQYQRRKERQHQVCLARKNRQSHIGA